MKIAIVSGNFKPGIQDFFFKVRIFTNKANQIT